MAQLLFSFLLNQYFKPFLFMVMKSRHFADRQQTASPSCSNSPFQLIFTTQRRQHAWRISFALIQSCWSRCRKMTERASAVFQKRHLYLDECRPSPQASPSHSSCVSWEHTWLMACQRCFVITPPLQEVLHSRNWMDSIGELTLMNKWEYFVICTSRQAYWKRWDVRQQWMQSGTLKGSNRTNYGEVHLGRETATRNKRYLFRVNQSFCPN